MTFSRCLASFCALVVAIAYASAATYNEATNGDLSSNRSAPTQFGLTVGSNDLFATTGGGDLDVVTVNVPAGNVLSQLFLRSHTASGFDQTAFVGLQAGSTFTVDPNFDGAGNLLGWAHFSSSAVNTNLLPAIGAGFDAQGFTPPLAAGPYSLFLQQLGSSVSYRLDFVVSPLPAPTWNVDADGNWSTAANWANGEPNGVGAAANFLGVITAPRTVTVDSAKTVGSLTFNNAQSYTLGGPGPLTINSATAPSIDVIGGSHTISVPLTIAAGKTATKSGAGTLTISGTQTHGAGAVLVASAGTTNLNSDAGANLSLQANSAVNLGSTQHLAGVEIGPGATVQLTAGASKTLVTPTLTFPVTPSAPTGKLDLVTNAAIVDYTGTTPAQTVRQQILAGRGGAGLGRAWNGQGITSSAAATAEVETRSVGYAENSGLPLGAYTTFHGQTVDNSAVLVAFTRTGDANLDGVVDDDDVTIVGASYEPGLPQPFWALGDFDYNGFVDDDDVTLLGAFYDPGATPIAAPVAAGAGVAAVPEPSTLVLISTLAAALFLSRRFRPATLR